jgi:hypothetical protein
VVTRVTGTTVNINITTGTATATCTGGQVLIGGGYTTSGVGTALADFLHVITSAPSATTIDGTWTVSALSGTVGATLTAFALCAG